tara:strand:+ start:261 stop:449 length:189 start_codon:yes stop_codon:yes gene_type:complete
METDRISLNNWIEKEREEIEEGKRLILMLEDYGLRVFINSHATDENGMIIVNENNDVLREGN